MRSRVLFDATIVGLARCDHLIVLPADAARRQQCESCAEQDQAMRSQCQQQELHRPRSGAARPDAQRAAALALGCFVRSRLEPELDLVTIGIFDVEVGLARDVLSLSEYRGPDGQRGLACLVHVFGRDEAKAEMVDSTSASRFAFLEHQNIVLPGSENLDAAFVAEVLADAEQCGVEGEGSILVGDGEADMREPVSSNRHVFATPRPGAEPTGRLALEHKRSMPEDTRVECVRSRTGRLERLVGWHLPSRVRRSGAPLPSGEASR